jgi:hypothetical protein
LCGDDTNANVREKRIDYGEMAGSKGKKKTDEQSILHK